MIRFFFPPPFKMADFSAKTAPGTSPTVRFWPPYSGPPGCNTNCIDRSQLIKIRRRDAIGVHTADRRETSATGHCGQPACRPPSNYWMSSMLLYVVYKGNTMNTLNWALYDKSTYRFHARRNISHIFYLFIIWKKWLINDFSRHRRSRARE